METNEQAVRADALARKIVAENGGRVVEEFELTKRSIISVFRSAYGDDGMVSCSVYLDGKPLCEAYNWEAATIIGSAMAYALEALKETEK